MLTGIVIENFISFKNKTRIDFNPTKYSILQDRNVSDNKVLKGALFVGPNASGKTNILEAIVFLINSINGDNTAMSPYRCLFSKDSVTKLTYYFKLLDQDVEYRMQFDDQNRLLSENLLINNEVVLKRNGTHGELYLSENPAIDNQLDASTSFLRTAAFNTGRFPQNPVLRAFIDYIQNSRYIDGTQISAFIGKNIDSLLNNEGTERFNQYLKSFNYDFFTEYSNKSTGEGVTLKFGDKKRTVIKRKGFSIPIPFIAESQGNKVFMDLLACLIPIIEKPGMIVIDEFGNSLHNKLAERIVTFFMEHVQNSQIFMTSHCTNLLSNSVFRPDQIIIVSFVSKEGSSVKRLSDYKPREAQNLEKMYLGGMFEGLPDYGEVI